MNGLKARQIKDINKMKILIMKMMNLIKLLKRVNKLLMIIFNVNKNKYNKLIK